MWRKVNQSHKPTTCSPAKNARREKALPSLARGLWGDEAVCRLRAVQHRLLRMRRFDHGGTLKITVNSITDDQTSVDGSGNCCGSPNQSPDWSFDSTPVAGPEGAISENPPDDLCKDGLSGGARWMLTPGTVRWVGEGKRRDRGCVFDPELCQQDCR